MSRLSFTSVAVLKAVADGSRHGFNIMDAASLPSGTVYPILGRLEEGGYVRSHWEAAEVAQKARRPARRYYEITAAGRRALEVSLEHFRTLGGRVPLTARPTKAGS
jgi:DNA-binding PadR family transcriptional regulator